MRFQWLTGAALALASMVACAADERAIVLKDGANAELTRALCSVCHSADYIPMNSPFLKRAGWDAEVHKMVKVMGAPITDEQAAKIVDYLTRYYGLE
jgi:mono/diheme cytochrome c family protein